MKIKPILYLIMALALVIGVSAETDFTISADPLVVVQDTTGYMTINVTNTGDENIIGMSYLITKPFSKSTDENITFAESDSGNLNIAVGGYQSLTLSFTTDDTTATGVYPGQISCTAGSLEKDLDLSVTVDPIIRDVEAVTENAEVVIDRLTNTTYSTTTGRINVTNTGNYPVDVVITTGDLTSTSGTIPASSVDVAIPSFSLDVDGFISTQVAVSGVGAEYPDDTYTGYLTVDYGDTSTEQVQFSVVVRSATASISPDSVTYPSSTRNVNVSTSVTITNDGDLDLSGCSLTDNEDEDTWISGTAPSSLAAGASFTVGVTSYLDETVDSGESTVATLTYACSGFSDNILMKSNVESKLQIDSLKISINDGSWDGLDDGDTYDDDLVPGDHFEVKLRVENLFDDDEEDLDIENIEVEATFYNVGEDGDDIEGEVDDDFDLDPEETSKDIYIEWDQDYIDWDADEGEQTMKITVTGEDDDGAEHTDEWLITFNIERENGGDFRITNVDAAPSSVRPGNSFMLSVDGRSVGQNDDDVKLKISSSALGLLETENFEMGAYDGDDDCNALDGGEDDEDCNEFSYRQSFKVPADLGQGTYEVKIELYADGGDDKVDQEIVDITVMGDAASSSTSSSTSSTTSSTSTTTSSTSTSTSSKTSSTKTSEPTEGTSTTSSLDILYSGSTGGASQQGIYASGPTMIKDLSSGREGGFTDSMAYLALLSIVGIVVVVLIVSLIAYAATRR